MLRQLILASLISQACLGLAQAHDKETTSPFDSNVQDLTPRGEPPMLGIHWSREFHAARLARTSSALMNYHGGKIMTTANMQAIFWGPSWSSTAFANDKISGLDSWYTGFASSNYAHTTSEYTQSDGKSVGDHTTYLGHLFDSSTAAGGASTSAILAEVCKKVSPDVTGNGYYPVYTDVKRGSAQYCAWHSAGSCGGIPVQFAFFFNLDGDAGCDPQDTSGQHSQGLAALANVTAHELQEARSDPANPGAWYDGSGAENGDKCAWTYGVPLVMLTNGTYWKLQGEWSNAAYSASKGYANASGQKGCLSGF